VLATLETAVRSMETQTFTDWELLILDDASTDNTVAIARELCDSRVRVIAGLGGNLGLAARLNQGVELARGQYIARMDGDDISFPQRLQRQWQFLDGHPAIDLVGCGMVIFKGAGELVGVQLARRTHEEICGNAVRSCLLPHATWMGRAAWFRAHRYDVSHRRAEDRELLLRTRDCSRFAGIPEPLYGYRVNSVSIRKNAFARFEYFRAVLSDARGRHDWPRYITGGAAEIAKLTIDTVAFATHTDKFVLRHRARRPHDRAVIQNWQSVWLPLQTKQAGVC
jgi:glycosyltransferase involved in cell wall biosynthesis